MEFRVNEAVATSYPAIPLGAVCGSRTRAVISVPGILGFYFVLHQLVEANSDQCDGYCECIKISIHLSKGIGSCANNKQLRALPKLWGSRALDIDGRLALGTAYGG